MLDNDLKLVLYCREIALRELRGHRHNVARLIIVHKYAYVPGRCSAGEECSSCWFLWRGRQYQIPLSVTHLLLIDYLCHQRLGKTAAKSRMDLPSHSMANTAPIVRAMFQSLRGRVGWQSANKSNVSAKCWRTFLQKMESILIPWISSGPSRPALGKSSTA